MDPDVYVCIHREGRDEKKDMEIGNEESGFSRLAKRTASANLYHGLKI